MKIVVLDGRGVNPGDLSYSELAQCGELTVYEETKDEQEAIARIGDAEILISNKIPVTETLLAACPNIRYVGLQSTGYNIVDMEAVNKRGIPVTNVPSYGTAAVGQYTMALLLELCHQVGLHNTAVHDGAWERCSSFCFWLTNQTELAGMTFGVIGFGKIGQAAGALAKAFGMRVLAYNRSRCPEGEAIAEYVDLDTLLRESDVVSLHCPQTAETENIMNRETLAKMKKTAFLLNTARGGLVDEAALCEALTEKRLAGAAVDVVSGEPMLSSNPLLNAPNCIITPHMAWAPTSSRARLLNTVVENLRAFQNGKLQNVVNKPR